MLRDDRQDLDPAIPAPIQRGIPGDTPVYTAHVTIDDLIVSDVQRETALTFRNSQPFLDHACGEEQIAAVWVEPAGEKFKVLGDNQENLMHLAAAIMRNPNRIFVIMFSMDEAPNA